MDSKESQLDLLNESDRGAVIVAAAILEDDLSELLKDAIQRNGLSGKQINEIFDLSGPLSSFSSKSLICYAFGLISKDTFEDLAKIRKLRNKFAHSTEKVDFLSSEIEDHVAEINCCIEASKKFEGEMFKGRGKNNAIKNHSPVVLEEWEARAKGFVKYTKSVFCLGVSILRLRIKEHHLLRIRT
ncbi:MltR family transcriptional regulator [Methylicorpusculum oleiharenae]|uniref:MltR family transcriptional regulator n=1 Tax=Methylicorpusculum oleiharenae TaxID=1338687 RepID=UPI00135A8B1E|nr:MltR family transcriptional regulator [Methylicorpusculum oleiharenae]MCD2453811.1 MltR family transcriptional regulator [Methylicorpusculum oleiharenae]